MQKSVRLKFTQFTKHGTLKPIEHCVFFPADPHALEQKHPRLFAHIKAHVGGSFSRNRLLVSSLLQHDLKPSLEWVS